MAREVRAQAIARAPQLTAAVAQEAQRVVQDKPGAAVGAALAVLGLLMRRRRRRREEDVKILYRPLSLLVSVLGGILAGEVFKKVWGVVSGEEEAPQATSPDYSTKEVLVAAVVQGAIFAGVKAAVDRAGAKGFKKITGKELGT